MKPLVKHTDLLYRIYVPITLVLILLAFVYTRYVVYATSISYIFLVLSGLLFFRKVSNTQIGTATQPYWQALLKIFALQICLFLIFYAINLTLTHSLPVAKEYVAASGDIKGFLQHYWLRWGFYPWTLYGLFAVVVAYQANIGKQSATIFSTLNYFVKSESQEILGSGLIRQSLTFACAITLGLVSLKLYAFLCYLFGMQPVLGPYLSTLFLFTTCIVLVNLNVMNKLMRYFWTRKTALNHLLVGLTLLWPIVLLMLTPIIHFIASTIMMPDKDYLISLVQFHSWYYPWQLFVWTWLLSITPLVVQELAKIIVGMTIRKALISILLLPVVMAIILEIHNFDKLASPFVGLVFSIIGSVIIIAYFYYSKTLNQLLYAAVYKDSAVKKFRLPLRITKPALQLIVNLTLIYLMFGLLGLTALYFGALASCIWYLVGVGYKFRK